MESVEKYKNIMGFIYSQAVNSAIETHIYENNAVNFDKLRDISRRNLFKSHIKRSLFFHKHKSPLTGISNEEHNLILDKLSSLSEQIIEEKGEMLSQIDLLQAGYQAIENHF